LIKDMSFRNAYLKFIEYKGWKPRILIEKGLRMLDEGVQREEPTIVLLELPTAYGKTTITISFAKAVAEGVKSISKVIHVLPMRSIADQLYDYIVQKENVEEKMVGLQHLGSSGSPFFMKSVVITTLDTFVMNFFKAPVAELHKIFERTLLRGLSHFEYPRAMIYSSSVIIFDEYHLFSPLGSVENEVKSFTSATYAICALAKAGVPVIVMTATMPLPLKRALVKISEDNGIYIRTVEYEEGTDVSYEKERKNKRIKLELMKEKDILEFVSKAVLNKKKVLLVFNSVKKAVEHFRILEKLPYKPVLIHGKLPEKFRKERAKEFKHKTPWLMVSTQVVESGLNLSFDALITDACPADRFIQRAGRVARDRDHNEGIVYYLKPSEDKEYPYDKNMTNRTFEMIKENEGALLTLGLSKNILENVYENLNIEEDLGLWQALFYLDSSSVLDSRSAKKAIEAFNGFTNSFGIVSGFMEKAIVDEMAVPLSEREAFNELEKRGELVRFDGKIETFNGRSNDKGLSLWLMENGYKGIIVGDFDPSIGYLGDMS